VKGQLYRVCRGWPTGTEKGEYLHGYDAAMRILEVDRKAEPGLAVWAEGEDGTEVHLLTPEQEAASDHKIGSLLASLGQSRSLVEDRFLGGYDAQMRKEGAS